MSESQKVKQGCAQVKFKCEVDECGDEATVSVAFLISSGNPYCPSCDKDMEPVDDLITILEEDTSSEG